MPMLSTGGGDKIVVMAYSNEWTRSSPGLMIFLINQGESMNELFSNGKTYAENAASGVNSMISETAIRFSSGTAIRDCANIVIIGYGGNENKMVVELLRSGSIESLFSDDSIPMQHLIQKVSDGAGGTIDIDVELKQFVSPKAIGECSITSAFNCASQILAEWVIRINESRDGNINMYPVPVIINFSNANVQITNQTDLLIRNIMNIELMDGNPLIINCIYDRCPSIMGFPCLSKMVDLSYKEFCNISSFIPCEILSEMKEYNGFPHVGKESKFLLLNPDNCTLGRLIWSILWADDRGTGGAGIIR